MRSRKFYGLIAVIGVCMALPRPAAGQSHRFTRILDNSSMLRPDGEPFGIAYAPTTPAFDGRWVVFRDPGPNNNLGAHAVIWSYDTRNGTLHKLVDLNTSVPGGAGTFQDLQPLDTAPSVQNGTVIFVARDSSSGRYRQGLYSVPAEGGTIRKVADYGTAIPSGGTFTVFDSFGKQVGAFSFDGTTVAFSAQGNGLGVYSAKADGSSLDLVADSFHPYTQNGTASAFSSPVIRGNSVVMIGEDGRQPGTDYNGIYLGTVGGNGTLTELLNSNQALSGNPNTSSRTRFEPPVLAFDGTLVVFRASDVISNSSGLYYTDLASHAIHKIADVNSTLPGLGKLLFIAYSGVAASHGSVLFRAADTDGNNALFLWRNGASTRIIGKGDRLEGQIVQDFTDPGPAALDGSSFVFNADFGRGMRGLYVAREAFRNVSAASYMSGAPLAAGSIATAFGESLASSTEETASQPPPTSLANSTVAVKDSAGVERRAPLFYVSPAQINYVVPDGTASGPAIVTVTSAGQATATGAVSIDVVSPGLFTANSDGKGVPVAAAVSVAPDLTQSTQVVARCGATQGSCVASPIDLGPTGTRVVLVLFGTGIRGRSSLNAVTADIGGMSAEVQYAGAQSQFAGLDQVNVLIPRTLAGRGEVDLTLMVDGKASNSVRVNIQ